MSMSDPIADMLTRIRNANTAKHDTVEIPASKMKKAIADILLSEGYVQAVDIIEDGKFETIKITLKYGADKNEKIITGLKRISKPGLRVYASKDELPRVLGGLGTAIISTNKGVLTDKEDGLSEEDAVADMDAPNDVVDQILADMPLTKLVKEKIKPSHRLKAWEIILLILGSPIWAPLLLTAIVLVIAMAVVILALLLSFYAIVLSMAVAGIGGLLGVIPFFVTQNVPAALFMLGAAFAGIGLAILFIVAVKPVTIGIFKLYKASVNGIKRMFVKER